MIASASVSEKLDIQRVLNLIRPDGHLSKILKGFEYRPQQEKMMGNVLDSYCHDQITLIEAGTGTGKSLSYIIPALVWATVHKERTVISTHTIALQEQLVKKDIPLLLNALNLKLKYALAKGMSNYICLRKLKDAQAELLLFPIEEREEIDRIDALTKNSIDGSRSELPFVPKGHIWDQVGAESEACSHQECPYYQDCYFYKARRNACDAQIVVANHSLLLSDLVRRAETNNYSETALLPSYKRIIIDEAHHLEEMATEQFASRFHRLELMRILGRLASEKQNRSHGKLPILKDKLQTIYNKTPPREIQAIIQKMTIDLHALRLSLNDQIHETFDIICNFVEQLRHVTDLSSQEEQKLRILEIHTQHPKWKEELAPQALKLCSLLKGYRQEIASIEHTLKSIDHTNLQEQTKGMRLDINGLLNRIEACHLFLENFLAPQKDPNIVRWIEAQKMKSFNNVQLVDASLDLSEAFRHFLFNKFSTIVLCSATLTTNQKFDYIRQRLGLTPDKIEQKMITENIYESPFNFQNQVMLAVPTDMPSPTDEAYNEASQEHIWKAIEASQGNTFVLFTSYSMLQNCYEALVNRCKEKGYTLLKQGDNQRHDLLMQFKKTDRSVLFGTDSFWEGVDVAGDALRCVIIVKLPFKVPTEPIIQARTQAIIDKGGNPFIEYSIPQAIVKFKQGFGRLIRNKWDRGCIVCLDTRLINKAYGKLFLDSLPKCEKIFTPGNLLYPKMREFYRKTYYLVKQNPAK